MYPLRFFVGTASLSLDSKAALEAAMREKERLYLNNHGRLVRWLLPLFHVETFEGLDSEEKDLFFTPYKGVKALLVRHGSLWEPCCSHEEWKKLNPGVSYAKGFEAFRFAARAARRLNRASWGPVVVYYY